MANSSFDYFRKNSKFAVILLGVLCIMAFVVADPLMQWMNASQTGGAVSRRGEVAVSWQGGELTEGELASLVSRRNILMAFLRQVEQMGAYEAIAAGAPSNLPTRVQPLRLPTEYQQGVERDVLRTKLLAEAARDAGMVIGDDTIVEYLQALGRDRVSRETMRELITGINLGRGRATTEFMFDLLREALLAQSYSASFAYAQATVTPQQRWEDWLKVNDRVVVETAALDVSDFVPQVDTPTDAVLTAYFEEYQDVVAMPAFVEGRELPSPTPGFRKPAKARLQYLKTDYATALEAARDEVTDEEIAEYYEENKAMFVKTASDDFMTGDDSELDALEVTDEPADESEPAAESEPPQGETDDAPAEESPVAEPPTDAPTDEAAEPAPDQSRRTGAASPFRLASFQEDQSDDEPAADEDEASMDAEPADADTNASEEGDPEEEEPAESEVNPLDQFMAGDDDVPPSDAGASASEDAAPTVDPEVEHQPLEEVEEEIRNTLAIRKAIEAQQQEVNDLKGILKNDYYEYFNKRIDAEANDKAPPEPSDTLVDFKKLGEENNLQYGETPLLTFFEMQDLKDPQLMYYFEQADQARSLAVQVFRRDGLELYQPDVAYDTDRNFYLVMVIEKVEESEPTLDDVREEVVAAWKREQAAKLALARAEELAKEASESGRSLEEQFGANPKLTIAESDMFAWFEPVGASATGMYDLRLDDPGSVEGAGPEFMEEVFSLGPNEAGAALSHGHNKAYVIRVSQRERSRSELRDAFLREWQVWPGIYRMQTGHVRDAAQAVQDNLLGGEEPDWRRTPDVSPAEREAAEGA